MSFFVQTGQTPMGRLSEELGSAIGQGIGSGIANRRENKIKKDNQSQLARALFGDEAEQFLELPPDQQMAVANLKMKQNESQLKQNEAQQKALRERLEVQALRKYQNQEPLTQEEEASLSASSLRSMMNAEKPVFEETSSKLAAERNAEISKQIENDYTASEAENLRLSRMEQLEKKGSLSTPLMVKTMDSIGLPLGILGNPGTEEYAKLVADNVRDVSKVFPGQIKNFEIESYMKTIPSLMNSDEGKRAIIRNRRLMNEAAELKYRTYKKIIDENKGVAPRNMNLLIQERVGPQLRELGERFKEGIEKENEKFQQPLRMVSQDGREYNIPPGKVEEAMKQGLRFK